MSKNIRDSCFWINHLICAAHFFLTSTDRPLTHFQKPTAGPLLYVRKPAATQQQQPSTTKKNAGLNDDEESVQRDTERRQALAEKLGWLRNITQRHLLFNKKWHVEKKNKKKNY